MDDGGSSAVWILFVILLFVNYVVSGFSAAIRVARPEDERDEEKRERQTKLIRKVLSDQSDFVDTVYLVTTLCSMGLGAFCAVSLQRYLFKIMQIYISAADRYSLFISILSGLIAGLIVLYVILTFAVDIPRRLGAHSPSRWISRWSFVIHLLIILFRPLTFIISGSAKGVLYIFGVRGTALKGDVTEEEIRSLVVEGHEQGVIQQTEAEMIANIFEFSDKEAKDIMTHRNEMIVMDCNLSLDEAVTFMLARRNSRFPVYEDNIDTIIGIAHLRDAVKYRENHPENRNLALRQLQSVLRQPVFVPETKNIDVLFQQMQKEKTQMVIVIDEYGQTSGLVAMEDILEEIVGNILDEYDVDVNHIFPAGNKNEFYLDGRTPLEEITRRFGINFDEIAFETLNGFLISQMDRIPEPNDHFTTEYGGYRFKIMSTADRKIQRVLLTKLEETI